MTATASHDTNATASYENLAVTSNENLAVTSHENLAVTSCETHTPADSMPATDGIPTAVAASHLRVLGVALVADLGVEAVVAVGDVPDLLCAAVGQVDSIRAHHVTGTVRLLRLGEHGTVVGVVDGVLVVVRPLFDIVVTAAVTAGASVASPVPSTNQASAIASADRASSVASADQSSAVASADRASSVASADQSSAVASAQSSAVTDVGSTVASAGASSNGEQCSSDQSPHLVDTCVEQCEQWTDGGRQLVPVEDRRPVL